MARSGRGTSWPRLRRFVDAEDQFQRFAAGAAVGVGGGLAAQHRQHVPVVGLVAVAVDVGRSVGRRLDALVVVVVVGELPGLHLVHRRAADLHRALLPEDRDRSFEVLRVGQHRDLDDAERPRAELEQRDAGVFGLDAAGERRRLGHHALHRADQPLDQVDVVRGLVHEGAAVKLPRAAPRRLVVVLLRARPAHGACWPCRAGRSAPCRSPA